MGMTVMHVGIVRVGVHERRVNVRMTVRFATVPFVRVGMLVVLVMRMDVGVFARVVCVQMTVMFREVQPDAACHEQSRSDQLPRNSVALDQHR